MSINLATQFSNKIDERFKWNSVTDAFAGHDYDFAGMKSVKIYSVDAVPVTDYSRSGTARFGALQELGDTVQELTMTQDKGFTFSVDAGNAADQLNIKQVAQRLKANWDEVATPMIDKYRFDRWIMLAGQSALSAQALTKTNIMEEIMKGSTALSNCLVPLKNRALFIKESVYTAVKLSSEVVGIDSLGESAIKTGVVGMIDGMKVVRVPDSYFPAGVNFFLKYKNATADPIKLKTLRVQKTPMGIDGDVGECRFYYDAFVLDNKISGLYIHSQSGVALPSISISGGSATMETATAGADIIYTADGSNPKTSATAKTYTEAVTDLESGALIRAYARKSGQISSGVAEKRV